MSCFRNAGRQHGKGYYETTGTVNESLREGSEVTAQGGALAQARHEGCKKGMLLVVGLVGVASTAPGENILMDGAMHC